MATSDDDSDAELLRRAGERAKFWNAARAEGPPPSFVKADLAGKRMVTYDLSDADLSGSNLRGTWLQGANLERANVDGADLTGAQLGGARLSEASFQNAILIDADLTDARARHADFTGADLTGANLDRCRLIEVTLTDATVGTNIERAITRDADVVWPALADRDVHKLGLCLDHDPDRPEWPWVTIQLNGDDVLGLKGHAGFPANLMFVPTAPLLPTDPPRRVAVYCCDCGEPGCGVIAPIIGREDSEIVWRDARTFKGVYSRPEIETDPAGGYELGLPDLRFDAKQYLNEVARAADDFQALG